MNHNQHLIQIATHLYKQGCTIHSHGIEKVFKNGEIEIRVVIDSDTKLYRLFYTLLKEGKTYA
jgi:hypothetical protein